MRDLTPRQRRFIEIYESGGVTQKEAYRIAYDNRTAKDTTISPRASRLMATPAARAYQAKIRKQKWRQLLDDIRKR